MNGLADAAFVAGVLPAAEGAGRAGVPRLDAALQHAVGQVQPGAVVAGEDDDRIVELALLAQRADDLARRPVDGFDHVAEQTRARAVAKAPGGVDRQMGHRIGHVEEEGLVARLFDELDGVLGVAHGQRVLVDRMLELLCVFVEPQRNVGLDPRRLHVVRVGQSEPVVEAFAHGQIFVFHVPEMPLAHHAGAVTGVLEGLREGELVGGDAARSAAAGAAHGHARRISPEHQLLARRHAPGGRVERRQAHAVGRESVEIGRAHQRRAERGEVAVAEVVGEQHDDIGSLDIGFLRSGGECADGEQDKQAKRRHERLAG